VSAAALANYKTSTVISAVSCVIQGVKLALKMAGVMADD
jgi:hypothetical protein